MDTTTNTTMDPSYLARLRLYQVVLHREGRRYSTRVWALDADEARSLVAVPFHDLAGDRWEMEPV